MLRERAVDSLNPWEDGGEITYSWRVIFNKVRPYRANFRDVGEVAGIDYMVITQSAWFKGYKDMDPKLIPQFEEGEREAIARQLLEAEDECIIRRSTLINYYRKVQDDLDMSSMARQHISSSLFSPPHPVPSLALAGSTSASPSTSRPWSPYLLIRPVGFQQCSTWLSVHGHKQPNLHVADLRLFQSNLAYAKDVVKNQPHTMASKSHPSSTDVNVFPTLSLTSFNIESSEVTTALRAEGAESVNAQCGGSLAYPTHQRSDAGNSIPPTGVITNIRRVDSEEANDQKLLVSSQDDVAMSSMISAQDQARFDYQARIASEDENRRLAFERQQVTRDETNRQLIEQMERFATFEKKVLVDKAAAKKKAEEAAITEAELDRQLLQERTALVNIRKRIEEDNLKQQQSMMASFTGLQSDNKRDHSAEWQPDTIFLEMMESCVEMDDGWHVPSRVAEDLFAAARQNRAFLHAYQTIPPDTRAPVKDHFIQVGAVAALPSLTLGQFRVFQSILADKLSFADRSRIELRIKPVKPAMAPAKTPDVSNQGKSSAPGPSRLLKDMSNVHSLAKTITDVANLSSNQAMTLAANIVEQGKGKGKPASSGGSVLASMASQASTPVSNWSVTSKKSSYASVASGSVEAWTIAQKSRPKRCTTRGTDANVIIWQIPSSLLVPGFTMAKEDILTMNIDNSIRRMPGYREAFLLDSEGVNGISSVKRSLRGDSIVVKCKIGVTGSQRHIISSVLSDFVNIASSDAVILNRPTTSAIKFVGVRTRTSTGDLFTPEQVLQDIKNHPKFQNVRFFGLPRWIKAKGFTELGANGTILLDIIDTKDGKNADALRNTIIMINGGMSNGDIQHIRVRSIAMFALGVLVVILQNNIIFIAESARINPIVIAQFALIVLALERIAIIWLIVEIALILLFVLIRRNLQIYAKPI
ncbi:hypothetical protein APHAL10511_005273 [Amanita phalloides]|nr:hypothetical protein APHAL10511_005273 [Amanita phalloides]